MSTVFSSSHATPAPSPQTAVARLGVVSFLNARPIISGLEDCPTVELIQDVPSRLIELVVSGRVDAGLCSSIDYLRSPEPLKMLSAAPLTCDGATLTVRVFSRKPIEEVTEVFCDADSHTSTALLSILMRDHWHIDPALIDFQPSSVAGDAWPDTVMLIGDKVVRQSPSIETHPHQLDLGEAWKMLTGLPFVFAVWMARADRDDTLLRDVESTLRDRLAINLNDLDGLIDREAEAHGWPAERARGYLNGLIQYTLGPREREGLQVFFDRADAHGLVEAVRPITFVEG